MPRKPRISSDSAGAAPKNKDRVLHTRIPAALEDEIKRAAEKLRIPVSNLVRNILQDAVELVGSVQKNVGDRVSEMRGKAGNRIAELSEAVRGAPRPGPADVLAWQPIEMGRQTPCVSCGRELEPGDEARLGLTQDPSVRIFSCPACAGHPTRNRSQAKGSNHAG